MMHYHPEENCISNVVYDINMDSHVGSQKDVAPDFSNKQLLPFVFEEQY